MDGELDGDTKSMALVARAAAAEVAEAIQFGINETDGPATMSLLPSLTPDLCRICGLGINANGQRRRMVRFLPNKAASSLTAGVPLVSEDITLHEFCGKTAGIMPRVNSDYEILSRAGIRNKHGTGSDVDSALARSRHAVAMGEAKAEHFYLACEFEAHLKAIRRVVSAQEMERSQQEQERRQQQSYVSHDAVLHAMNANHHQMFVPLSPAPPPRPNNHQHQSVTERTLPRSHPKPVPVRAAARTIKNAEIPKSLLEAADAAVRCGCGGTYLFLPGTSRGKTSWRNHMKTERHLKWMESTGHQ